MKIGRKIAIIGAGNVGATVAYTLTVAGLASEIVLIDVNFDKARGETMDILQGTPLCAPVSLYAGDYTAARDADIVIVTAGAPRKPGQTRIDLAQGNVNIIKSIMPEIVAYAPDAIYIVVSNPVDILTYAVIKACGVPAHRVIGSGTMLDTARLRSGIAEHVGLNPKNVHGYVLGEHGDTSVVAWSTVSIAGMSMAEYCSTVCANNNNCGHPELAAIEDDMRTSGSKIIKFKGATYYAVSLAVRRIVECIVQDAGSIVTVGSLLNGEYGIEDVCLSIPYAIGANGIERPLTPPLPDDELAKLHASAAALKNVIASIDI